MYWCVLNLNQPANLYDSVYTIFTNFSIVGLNTNFLFTPLVSNYFNYNALQDFTLITSLARSASLFIEDLQNQPPFSESRYGSVDMFYVVCSQDLAIPAPFQHWMIENKPVKEVRTIEGADHMAMLSTPKELSDCLLHFASLS